MQRRIDFDSVEKKVDELWYHKRNLMQTATGYGNKIVTQWKIRHNNRWYRLYCAIHSNIGTSYIIVKGEKVVVN